MAAKRDKQDRAARMPSKGRRRGDLPKKEFLTSQLDKEEDGLSPIIAEAREACPQSAGVFDRTAGFARSIYDRHLLDAFDADDPRLLAALVGHQVERLVTASRGSGRHASESLRRLEKLVALAFGRKTEGRQKQSEYLLFMRELDRHSMIRTMFNDEDARNFSARAIRHSFRATFPMAPLPTQEDTTAALRVWRIPKGKSTVAKWRVVATALSSSPEVLRKVWQADQRARTKLGELVPVRASAGAAPSGYRSSSALSHGSQPFEDPP